MTTETTTKEKRVSLANKIRAYKLNNPKAMPKDIAAALGIPVARIYATNNYDQKRAKKLKAKKKAASLVNLVPPTLRGKFLNATQSVDMDARTPKADNVNHPAHYKVGGIETIDFIEAKQLNYNLGNVVKYITRADHKGNTQEDLLKARWYLNREISKGAK